MVSLEILFGFILLLVFLYKWRSITHSSASRKRPPPSPLRLPIIGNSHLIFGTLDHRSLLSLSKRHGELMLLHIGNKPVLIASSVEAAREIMKNQDAIFANRPSLSIAERLVYGFKDVAFAPYDENWRRARSICVLQLLTNQKVQSYRHIREEETSLMVEKIKRLGQSSRSVVNLSKVLMELTNDIVCLAAVGRKYTGGGEGERDFNSLLNSYIAFLGWFNVGDYIPWLAWINRINGVDAKVKEVARLMDEFLEGVLREFRENKVIMNGDSVPNFMETLLEFQRVSKDKEAPLEDDVIKAIILDVFSAATDTTYATLEWTLAELIRNPRVMKLLQKEVREVARNKNEITEDDLDKMPYLRAVSKEVLRLYPPFVLGFPRESTQDTKVLGYDIPSGAIVHVNVWAIARDPLLWTNPHEFRPERFFDTSIDYRGFHFEMLPFGAGRRGCPGVTFAMAVYELALAKLVNEFDFGLPNGARLEDLDMTESNGMIIHKKSPLMVVATSHAS